MSAQQRILVIEAGFSGNSEFARNNLSHADAEVRSSALRALHRIGNLTSQEVATALNDNSWEVRRTAAELSVQFLDVHVHHLLNDPDVYVAEMTAWSLGERTSISDDEMSALITNTTQHDEAVVREACAAALGSIGDERGLPAILAACSDKPAVRRRAVLALAPFEGDLVDAALQKALEDNDWQVRQNAEVLLHPRD